MTKQSTSSDKSSGANTARRSRKGDAVATADKRGPGRPAQDKDLRAAILDSAGITFAEKGFAGARIREIAALSGVNQALINYYFHSKQQLFDQVFLSLGREITSQREKLLDELLTKSTPPTVECLVTAYLRPQWEMKHSGPRGAAFVKLQARMHAEPDEHAIRLRREVYDRSTKRYLRALNDSLPHLSERTVGLRLAFMIGTYLFMLNDLGRISDLTETRVDVISKTEMMNNLIKFLCTGFAAPEVDDAFG
ncbi:TetR/AcrR family transcriptional regulator [Pseudorhodobacter aquimaris]|uniref:TetR/AcrR family transcriptional regulator n=1 Tax=Pseudorhodobacter aquimaris TaxID=687412 RepID=UPI0009FB4F19|nr:TetR/AcrR family transcriptional regulator [Pseudorhodobacter aquimaris]